MCVEIIGRFLSMLKDEGRIIIVFSRLDFSFAD